MQDMETTFAYILWFSRLANSNMLTKILREQRELP